MRKDTQQIEIATLPSGLKVVCRRLSGADVEYCGAVVKVGSRDDAPDAPGLAHFVEHTIFKGTEKRSSWHIINRMERVGGELNAYTTKEETVVYTAAPRGNVMRAMELIADLSTSSRFPQSELDKEREVVEDEINSYLDTPSEAVYDDFEDMLFSGTSLGHNILGTTAALSTFDSLKCREYLRKWYTTKNMVVFYFGPASAQRVVPIVEKCFQNLPQDEPKHEKLDLEALKASHSQFKKVNIIDTHQAHTVMGSVIGGLYSDNRYPMALLTNILGGPGMNSRLNIALREKRGLVYSVEASTTLFSDCGIFNVYFGCDPSDTNMCEELVRKQVEDIKNNSITKVALSAAKKQYLGQLAVASDSRDSLAISTGRSAMYFDRILSSAEMEEKVNGITQTQIAEAAESISHLSMLTLQ